MLARRSFLRIVGGSAGLLIVAPALIGLGARAQSLRWSRDPFSLGVASGSPAPDGFVLWTRLAPDPLSTDPQAPGGIATAAHGGDIEIAYEIATDPAMHDIVQRGTATAEAAFAHSVHLEVTGLAPARPYWYRFTSGNAQSRTGCARTAPAPGSAVERMSFGFVSCSNYEEGYFAAYRHLADEHPDLVFFLGDYIYEYVTPGDGRVREHSDGVETKTLSNYRNRYAQYRLDRDLQRLHATAPSLVTWDDHEIQNDYADEWSEEFEEPDIFLERRTAGYQAFYEHMPVRPSRPKGNRMRIYDRYAFGDLAEFSLLDGRQYRSRTACYIPPDGGGAHLENDQTCPERRDRNRTMLGMPQEAWLYKGLAQSKARWNVIAQNMMMAEFGENTRGGDQKFSTDDWNGYPEARARLLRQIEKNRVSNPVILSGDMHSFWTNDLRPDFSNPDSAVVATEFITTSITSGSPPQDSYAKHLPFNPHVRFFESRKRGYASVDLTPDSMTTRFQAISDPTDPNATLSTLETFIIENGRAGAIGA